MNHKINRRQFLKLLSLLPAAYLWNSEFTASPRKVQSGLPERNQPNILLLVYDTFSARHCSLYGYPRKTTPNLERLARRATVYHRHHAPANFTSPGTASLLTGLYPWTHRCFHLHGTVADNLTDVNLFELLSGNYHRFAYTHNPQAAILLQQFSQQIDDLTRISELCLASHSYADKYLFDDIELTYDSELLVFRNGNYPASSLFIGLIEKAKRLLSDFQINARYRDQFPLGVPNFFDEDKPSFLYFTLEQATDWIIEQAQQIPNPYFGYVHVLPPHGPYTPPVDSYKLFIDGFAPTNKPASYFSQGKDSAFLETARRLYDEYIVYVDTEIGRLVDTLEKNGNLENTIVMITSDHGELFERGVHSHLNPLLYQPLIHVPLVVIHPSQKERLDVHSLTSNVDLLPTIAEFAGVPVPTTVEGIPLPGPENPLSDSNRAIYALDAKQNSKFEPIKTATGVILQNQYKLIGYFGYSGYDGIYELYNLDKDPEELVNLIRSEPAIFEELKTKLLAKMNYQSNR